MACPCCCSQLLQQPFDCGLITILNTDGALDIVKSDCSFTINLANPSLSSLIKQDSQSVQLLGTGFSGNPLRANVKISGSIDNALQLLVDGLYVAPAASGSETANSAIDTATVDIVVSGPLNRQISANVKRSGIAGNILNQDSNGLYVLLNTTVPLSFNSGSSTLSMTQASTSNNGYLTSVDWNTFNSKLGSIANLGVSGARVYSSTVSGVANLRRIVGAASEIVVTENANDITLSIDPSFSGGGGGGFFNGNLF